MTEPRSSHSQLPWVMSGPAEAPAYAQPTQPPQFQYDQGVPPQYPAPAPAYVPPPQNPYGPPRRSSRWPIVLGVPLAILMVGVNVWTIVVIHADLSTRSHPSLSAGGGVQAIGLRSGACYQEPANPSASFSSVQAIDCAKPHDAQAFYSFTYPGATATAPSDDDLKATAQPRCLDAAKSRVDRSKLPRNAHASLLFADGQTWARGFHDITCVYVADADFTGSFVKG